MRLRTALAIGVAAATVGTAVVLNGLSPAVAHAAAAQPSLASPAVGRPSARTAAQPPLASPAVGRPSARTAARPALAAPPGVPQRTPGVARPPTCGEVDDSAFPIGTRLRGGAGEYRPGDEYRTWHVELRNTTREPCRGVHPVVALTDRDRVLKPAQIRMEFYDGQARRWRPVAFEATEEDENVGVFDDGFPGFALAAGKTLAVPVRLAFTPDAAPNEVAVTAAVVQRRGDDGDWIGESDEYRFTLAPPTSRAPSHHPRSPQPVPPPEMARTGPRPVETTIPATGAAFLVGAGTVLVVAARRRMR